MFAAKLAAIEMLPAHSQRGMREVVKAEEAAALRALQERETHARVAYGEEARKLGAAYRCAAAALTTRKTPEPSRSRNRGRGSTPTPTPRR